MGRQTRTELPVPHGHLQLRTVPPKDVQKRLKEIRNKQIYYNRSLKKLPELQEGSAVSVYDTTQRTLSPAIISDPAGTSRSYIVATSDGHHLRRIREHLLLKMPRCKPWVPQRKRQNSFKSQSSGEVPKSVAHLGDIHYLRTVKCKHVSMLA